MATKKIHFMTKSRIFKGQRHLETELLMVEDDIVFVTQWLLLKRRRKNWCLLRVAKFVVRESIIPSTYLLYFRHKVLLLCKYFLKVYIKFL